MAIRFYLSNRADKKGDYPIRVSISVKGTRLLSTVGYSIAREKWNASGQKVRGNSTNSKGVPSTIINSRLKKITARFIEYECGVRQRPSIEDLKMELSSVTGRLENVRPPKVSPTLSQYYTEFIREESRLNQWSQGTLEPLWATRKHIESAGIYRSFDDFDEQGLVHFIDHLRNKCMMRENTVRKHFSNLRWFLNWAIRRGYCTEVSIKRYKPKFKIVEKPVIFLTKDELMRLYNYEIPEDGTKVRLLDSRGQQYEKEIKDAEALARTRDLFCFCAFTSLRYSDMAKLKRTDIVGDYIHVITQKTNDRLPIDLNEYSKAILDKYRDCRLPDDLALPVLSNQKMNTRIKELGELCGFNEPVTRVSFRAGEKVTEIQPKWQLLGTHAARRTFICTMLSMGISPQIVMKWTGHSDYKAMKPYIDIAESAKAEAMNLFSNGLKDL
jgi:integrase